MNNNFWMLRVLDLARQGAGKTSPNPMVGALIVRGEVAVGEGFHEKAGWPHAEIEALQNAGEKARGATLFVNLEPCCHQGKTPPCTKAIIGAGIQKVVVAMLDPNPMVHGKGIAALEKAGIPVEVGLFEEEARSLNEIFIKWVTKKIPYIVLKAAMTLDGKMPSQWITGERSREKVHEMRSSHDAVLVGINTVLKDDPQLTSRIPKGKNPIRIVLDSLLKIPLESRVVKTAREVPTWVAASLLDPEKKAALQKAGVAVLHYPGSYGKVDLSALCHALAEKEITSVLVEGGAKVHASFLKAGLVDKLVYFMAPKLLGDRDSLKDAILLKEVKVQRIGEDIMIEGRCLPELS